MFCLGKKKPAFDNNTEGYTDCRGQGAWYRDPGLGLAGQQGQCEWDRTIGQERETPQFYRMLACDRKAHFALNEGLSHGRVVE